MASHGHDNGHGNNGSGGHGHHYILPTALAVKVWIVLLALTIITVALSYVHLGVVNYFVGILVATVKAALVALIFMNLAKDNKSNLVIFCSSFIFLAIFIALTGADIWFRGNVYTTRGQPLLAPGKGSSNFKKPWEPTPELVAHGKTVFAQNCVACHGDQGMGNGPAAAALNPKPRNFTQDAGWLNGRKPSQIFKTLKEGVGKMASFGTLPQDDRWALAHYVTSFNPNPLKDSPSDWVAIGIDPKSDTGGVAEAKSISIDMAMSQMAKDANADSNVAPGQTGLDNYDKRLKARTFSK